MRGIAAGARVDAALVHHYFGTKEQLLTAAIELPFEPAQVATAIADAPAEGRGERMARIFLTVWEDPAGRAPLLALFRSAMAHESAALLLRQFAKLVMVGRVAPSLDGPDRELRAEIAASHLIGLAMGRYVLKIEPLASASVDDLVALVAPAIQHYFDPDSVRAGEDASDEMANHSGRRGPWDPAGGSYRG
jgi:AcrR family transcriptional regulator